MHDVFLERLARRAASTRTLLRVALSLTEGRAYSAAEYRAWLGGAGLECGDIVETLVHCGVLPASKP